MNEWPLLIFTFLMQTSIGLAIMLGLFSRQLANYFQDKNYFYFIQLYLLIMCVFAGVGLIASITHLGVPLNAPNSILNLFSSWLSREVIFTATYFACIGSTLLWLWFKKKLSFILLGIGIVMGLLDVYAMASIYRHTMMLSWMHNNTYLMFYGTMLTCGAACFYLLIKLAKIVRINASISHIPARWLWSLCGIIAFSLVTRLVYQPFYEHYLTHTLYINESATFPISPIEVYQAIWPLRLTGWILAIFAVVVAGYAIARNTQQQSKNSLSSSSYAIFAVACLLSMLAEFILRYGFYYIHL